MTTKLEVYSVLAAIRYIKDYLNIKADSYSDVWWHDKDGDSFKVEDTGAFFAGLDSFEEYLEDKADNGHFVEE